MLFDRGYSTDIRKILKIENHTREIVNSSGNINNVIAFVEKIETYAKRMEVEILNVYMCISL